MLHVGLDLSRTRVDVHVKDDAGNTLLVTVAPVDANGLRGFAAQVDEKFGEPVRAVIESMTGARHVYDVLTEHGWPVQVADAAIAKGMAKPACKTDKTDAKVLAELSRLGIVPAIWLPPMPVRAGREWARWRFHLVKHRSMFKNRVHSILMNFGIAVKESDLFGTAGRKRLAGLELPQPWAAHVADAVANIDALDTQIDAVEKQLAETGKDDPLVKRLKTCPGIGPVLGYTIAVEIGDIGRFATAVKLVGYTGLCPRVYQSGDKDRRGPLSKHGPKYLRWALIEATTHACKHPKFAERYKRTLARLGAKPGQRGRKIARVEVARELAKVIWHMLTKDEDFDAPTAGATGDLAA